MNLHLLVTSADKNIQCMQIILQTLDTQHFSPHMCTYTDLHMGWAGNQILNLTGSFQQFDKCSPETEAHSYILGCLVVRLQL